MKIRRVNAPRIKGKMSKPSHDLLRERGWRAAIGSAAEALWEGERVNRSTDFFWASDDFAALRNERDRQPLVGHAGLNPIWCLHEPLKLRHQCGADLIGRCRNDGLASSANDVSQGRHSILLNRLAALDDIISPRCAALVSTGKPYDRYLRGTAAHVKRSLQTATEYVAVGKVECGAVALGRACLLRAQRASTAS